LFSHSEIPIVRTAPGLPSFDFPGFFPSVISIQPLFQLRRFGAVEAGDNTRQMTGSLLFALLDQALGCLIIGLGSAGVIALRIQHIAKLSGRAGITWISLERPTVGGLSPTHVARPVGGPRLAKKVL
jgi:hypothetical protein